MAQGVDENTKHQAPNTRKVSNHKLQGGDVAGRIGIWSLGILWCLELGFWCFHPGVWSLEFGISLRPGPAAIFALDTRPLPLDISPHGEVASHQIVFRGAKGE